MGETASEFDELFQDGCRVNVALEIVFAKRLGDYGACRHCRKATRWAIKVGDAVQRSCGADCVRKVVAGMFHPRDWSSEAGEENSAIPSQADPPAEDPNIVVHPTGAVRSADANDVRYDLISPIGLRRLAAVHAEWARTGGRVHGENNWLKGLPFSDTGNHGVRHYELWRAGDDSEDHLAKNAWALFALMHLEETRPDLDDRPFKRKKEKEEAPCSSDA